jgi:iron complex outermembrane receptor protein
MKTFNFAVCHVALATALIAGSAAHAQTSGGNDDEAAVAPVAAKKPAGQIVTTTTAQKRFENLQNVPLAVQVITPRQLEEQGVRHFQDLGKVAPSLVIKPADQPVSANVSIRGVGTFAFGIGVETSVAVTVDGAAVAFMPRVFADLPDIAQIEVLRGPQSTLYGKAASAGLIKIMTVQPTDEFHFKGNALATTDSEFGGNFSVTGPFSDTLGYVLSVGYSDWAGNVKNLANGADANGRASLNSRAKLRWKATPDLTFTLSGNYLNGSTTIGRPFVALAPNALLRNVAGQTNNVTLPGVMAGPENQDISNNFRARTKYWGAGTLLRSELNLGKLNILSLTSYDRFRLDDYVDGDETSSIAAVGNNNSIGAFKSRLFTQELRLLSPGEDAFRYALGLYYADVGFERPFMRGPAFSVVSWNATSGSRQIAGFGQIDWEFVAGLTATAGGRVQNERINYTFRDKLAAANFAGNSSANAGTYRLGLSYQATPDIMVFGGYTTGYKGETYDLTSGFNAARAAAGPIRPERSRDKELGVRTQFFDRHLTVNLTYFNIHYEDLQAQSIETLPSGIQAYRLTNVGGLDTKGLELETAARIAPDLSFNGAVTYLDATYSSFPVAQCYALQTAALGCRGSPASQNLTGTRAVQAPEWKGSASIDYTPSIGGDLTGVAQASWQYQSSLEYIARDPQAFQPAFSIFNVSLGVRNKTRGWEATAFINNLFDKQYYQSVVNNAGTFGNRVATQAVLPRDFRRYGGVRVGLSF